MQGVTGDVVREITGHRSRELERYQHLAPLFRSQTVDLIAQVLFGGTPAGISGTPTDNTASQRGRGEARRSGNPHP
jgi:hypothetical protein